MKTTQDRAAAKTVAKYIADYSANRGLVACFPRLCVAMMPSLEGHAVRNADGGRDIAHFSTYEAASLCLARAHGSWLDARRGGTASAIG